MKTHVINGKISVLGDYSNPENRYEKKYEYIEFEQADGTSVVVKKAKVPYDVDRMLVPNASGTFLVFKIAFPPSTEILAVKVDGREAVNEFVTSGVKQYVRLYSGLILSAGFFAMVSLLLVGIPFLLMTLWAMVRYPFWMAKLRSTARDAGFTLARTRTI